MCEQGKSSIQTKMYKNKCNGVDLLMTITLNLHLMHVFLYSTFPFCTGSNLLTYGSTSN